MAKKVGEEATEWVGLGRQTDGRQKQVNRVEEDTDGTSANSLYMGRNVMRKFSKAKTNRRNLRSEQSAIKEVSERGIG